VYGLVAPDTGVYVPFTVDDEYNTPVNVIVRIPPVLPMLIVGVTTSAVSLKLRNWARNNLSYVGL